MSASEIVRVINQNQSFAVAVHINPDGDCLGSAAALVSAIRGMGKCADIFLDGTIPDRLSFVWKEDFFGNINKHYDVCIAVDVAADYMMGSIKETVFDKTACNCCIDHHGTNNGYAMYNCINADASAAGEVVFDLIKNQLGISITDDIARYLYIAIASDTGGFRYSNTTSETHEIASKLMKYNIDAPIVMRMLFEQKSINQLRIRNDVVADMRFYEGNKICIASVDKNLLDKYNMSFEQTDDLAQLPRSIRGVEVGVYLKIKSDNEVKASLRSNDYADVSAVAAALGGGGHKRAAGVTINASAEEAEKLILNEIKKVM